MPWSDSLHSPSYDLSDQDLQDFFTSTNSTDPPHSPSPRRAPRLTSPRLLRDILSAQPSGSALPQPVNYQDAPRDFQHALHDVNMALRNTQAAFRQGRSTPNTDSNVVDLTNSSDDPNDDIFMTQTRHPHDSSQRGRPANSMNEPAYGPRQSSPPTATFTLGDQSRYAHNPIPSFRSLLQASRDVRLNPNPNPNPDIDILQTVRLRPSNADASAVHRQRQARRSWERVERRNRERAQEQAQRDAQERAQREHARQAETQQITTAGHGRRRDSSTSSDSSSSDLSATSLGSDSADSVFEEENNHNTTTATNTQDSAVDLTLIDDSKNLEDFLAKEQQDAIAAQLMPTQNPEEKNLSSLNNYKCAICMDSPTNATTTICGHLFCHRCILDSLKWSERQRREDRPPQRRLQGLCPVCRKPLQNKEVGASGRGLSGGLVNLEIKTMSRKQYRDNKAREKFLESMEEQVKGKQRAQTEENDVEVDGATKIKADVDEEDSKIQGLALSRGRRKRKRDVDPARRTESAEQDSLFGSP